MPEELLPLFRIGPDLVHAHRARALFDAGFKTHEDLAVVSQSPACSHVFSLHGQSD